MAEWIEESILGAKIHRVHGGNFGGDALSLSFSGNLQRDKHFVPLSQGHRRNQFTPVGLISRTVMKGKKAGAKHSKSSIARQSERKPAGSVSHGRQDAVLTECYDTHGNATTSLHNKMKAEAKAIGVPFVPPPPKTDTQIVRLKCTRTAIYVKMTKNKRDDPR